MDISDINMDNTLLITYENPFIVPEHNLPRTYEIADMCFKGKKEAIQGIKLGVRLGLKMKFFSTDHEMLDFAEEFYKHYTS